MWTCLSCQREFKITHQQHTCKEYSLDLHFGKRNPEVRASFEALMHALPKIGKSVLHSSKTTLSLRNKATFVTLCPEKKQLKLVFALARVADEFPVVRTREFSKNKIAHVIYLDGADQVDEQLIRLLKEAYGLTNK
jgi:hypothetical protein